MKYKQRSLIAFKYGPDTHILSLKSHREPLSPTVVSIFQWRTSRNRRNHVKCYHLLFLYVLLISNVWYNEQQVLSSTSLCLGTFFGVRAHSEGIKLTDNQHPSLLHTQQLSSSSTLDPHCSCGITQKALFSTTVLSSSYPESYFLDNANFIGYFPLTV